MDTRGPLSGRPIVTSWSDTYRWTVAQRLFRQVSFIRGGCWLWTGWTLPDGYAQMRVGGRQGRRVLVHRLAYELLVGPIPKGFTIDHLCRNRACVNPSHLEPVTMKENALRTPDWQTKAECLRGHPYVEENTYRYRRSDGRLARRCRTCHRDKIREAARRKAQA